MLKIDGLKKKYPDFSLDLNLEVKPGYITGLLGRNGSGKSTTFKAILDLIHIDSGEISILGKNPKDLMIKDKENIGVVLADSSFSKYISVNDVRTILKNMYKNFNKDMFDSYINNSAIDMNKKIKDLSTGMKAKVNLIAAISHKAKFLLLDEPTAGLDVVAREEMLNLLRDYMEQDEENSILISSHISSDLENLCDDLYLIDKGKIVFHDDTDKILGEYAVIKVSKNLFEDIDKSYVLAYTEENYGYKCICRNRSYYIKNFPDLVIEKANIDELIKIITGGK